MKSDQNALFIDGCVDILKFIHLLLRKPYTLKEILRYRLLQAKFDISHNTFDSNIKVKLSLRQNFGFALA